MLDASSDPVHFPHMPSAARKLNEQTFIWFGGDMFQPTPEGALWWQAQKTLIVSDLHLEKGSSYARRGQLLPPYDTGATLALVERLAGQFAPDRIISLGDSFHDALSEERLAETDIARIRELTGSCDWFWVEGNHDPEPPAHLGGRGVTTLRVGDCVFRHEPTGARGEISGHLHPVARIGGRGRSVRRKCFVTDGHQMIMPSLGTLTGGLNVLDDAVTSCFAEFPSIFVTGGRNVYLADARTLKSDVSDRGSNSGWRL
ncbi:MAG: ligase-associated DNA damage response endonuclease PdeM [Henriciella sp.]|uniref:ligase-associated DNA damage response endonuclease PdeM n=1 Tax=Henriciella sp. TaxID=1968823 RepID=UPI003C7065C9